MVVSLVLFFVSWTAYSVQAKEPYASAEEYSKYIVNKDSVRWTEPVPGVNSHLIKYYPNSLRDYTLKEFLTSLFI
jgi:hypothetical protein